MRRNFFFFFFFRETRCKDRNVLSDIAIKLDAGSIDRWSNVGGRVSITNGKRFEDYTRCSSILRGKNIVCNRTLLLYDIGPGLTLAVRVVGGSSRRSINIRMISKFARRYGWPRGSEIDATAAT